MAVAEARPGTLPRGRHRLTREEVAASQHGRLLLAMAQVVADEGYVNTTVADVSARAGVSTRTFYEHFATKEDCFLASHAVCIDALVGIMRSAIGSTRQRPMTRFGRVLRAYLDALTDQPALARTFLIEVYAAGPRAMRQRLEAQACFAELLAEIFGASRRDRFQLEALVGTISSLVTNRVSVGDHAGLAALHGPITRFVARHLGLAGLGGVETGRRKARAR
jgi:AcrR family transcriptional regulator